MKKENRGNWLIQITILEVKSTKVKKTGYLYNKKNHYNIYSYTYINKK